MRKRRLKVVETIIMLFIMVILLSGCGENVLFKYDDKTVTVNSSSDCTVTITLKVKEGNVENTVQKDVEIKSGKTKILTIQDFASDFFEDSAVISEVSVKTNVTAEDVCYIILNTFLTIVFIIVVLPLSVLSIFGVIKLIIEDYEPLIKKKKKQ